MEGITRGSLKEALNRIGLEKTQEDIDEMFEAHDVNKDHRIDFEEFKGIFGSDVEIFNSKGEEDLL